MSVSIVNKSDGSLSKVAGKIANGELIPSVSEYKSGFFNKSDLTDAHKSVTQLNIANPYVNYEIVFDEPMTGDDYVLVFEAHNTNLVIEAASNRKTKTGFVVSVRNTVATARGSMGETTDSYTWTIADGYLQWQAFRLMTNEQHTLDEQAIIQNTSDISDLQDDKQDKTLKTALTIGGTSRTTVEDALGGLNDLVPSGASAENQLLVENTEYPKTLLQGYQDTAGVLKVAFNQATQCSFLVNIGYGGVILVSVHTRNDRVTAMQLGSQSGSTPTNITIKVSDNGLTLFFAWNADAPISIVQLYKPYYNATAETVSRVSTSDTNYATATAVNVRRAITSSDLTSSVTSGSNAPITSGGVASALKKHRICIPWKSNGDTELVTSSAGATGSVALAWDTWLKSNISFGKAIRYRFIFTGTCNSGTATIKFGSASADLATLSLTTNSNATGFNRPYATSWISNEIGANIYMYKSTGSGKVTWSELSVEIEYTET